MKGVVVSTGIVLAMLGLACPASAQTKVPPSSPQRKSLPDEKWKSWRHETEQNVSKSMQPEAMESKATGRLSSETPLNITSVAGRKTEPDVPQDAMK